MKKMNNLLTSNQIYNDIFTNEELKLLYDQIDYNETNNATIVNIFAQKAWHTQMPKEIIDKMCKIAKNIYQQDLILEEISFARYSNEYGKHPVLTPHYDNSFLEQRLTIDVQLKSNISWPIVIEGRSFLLKDNSAITFSGTHQVHWREHRDFLENDFIEMLFCHFSLKHKKRIGLTEKLEIEKKMVLYSNQFSMELIKQLSKCKEIK
jgi:hypothetical protein